MLKAGEAFTDVREFSRARAKPLAPEDRRDAILDAVLPLLREKGRDVSSRQLAEAAGVAEGTLFRAFGDKESLIAAAIARIFDHTPLWAALRAIDLDESFERKLGVVVVTLREHLRHIVAAVIALRIEERHPGPDPEDRQLADILRDVFAGDIDRFAVPIDVVADYIRMVAFSSALPLMPAFADDVLSGLIARGILLPTADPTESENR
jgi:AcrR family transcriptional regulator